MSSVDKFIGCFLGLACGDAHGAPYEGGFFERLAWKIVGKSPSGRMRFTDDTQMSIDLAKSVLQNNELDQEALALHFAGNYCWTRGYGPGAAHTLYLIKKGRPWQEANRARFPNGSFGNGAAMRAPIAGMLYNGNIEATCETVLKSSEITHAHPEAIEGAILIALSVQCGLAGHIDQEVKSLLEKHCRLPVFKNRLDQAFTWLEEDYRPSRTEIVKSLGNGIAAAKSCVTAIYLALANSQQPFASLLEAARDLGGDVDTIGAMAGAIWGAFHGLPELPSETYTRVENFEEIIDLAEKIFKFNQTVSNCKNLSGN